MKVTLRRFENLFIEDLPATRQTFYKWSRKKKIDWLCRDFPSDHCGRILLVDVHKCITWAEPRGRYLMSCKFPPPVRHFPARPAQFASV